MSKIYWEDEGDKLCLYIDNKYREYEEPLAEINKENTLDYSINQKIFDPIFVDEHDEFACPEAYPFINEETIEEAKTRIEGHIKFDLAMLIRELGDILVGLNMDCSYD